MAIAEMPTEISPQEVEAEETKMRIHELARGALDDFTRILGSNEGDRTTTNIAELASWLEQNAGENKTSLRMVVGALKEAHIWMDDEKHTNINAKIDDVVGMMKKFVSDPDSFRTQRHTNPYNLRIFCETLSRN